MIAPGREGWSLPDRRASGLGQPVNVDGEEVVYRGLAEELVEHGLEGILAWCVPDAERSTLVHGLDEDGIVEAVRHAAIVGFEGLLPSLGVQDLVNDGEVH